MVQAAAARLHTDMWAAVLQAMVANCNIMGKPIIITRLVDTMSSNPRPTRCLLSGTKRQLDAADCCGCHAVQCSMPCANSNFEEAPIPCSLSAFMRMQR